MLSELCSEFRSGRNISATLIHKNGDYPVYGGNGIRGYCNQYSHDGEYVVVGRQGALCGNVRLIQGKNYLSEHAIAVQANEANETKFLLYLLDYMKLGQYSDQGAQPGLAVNKLLRLKCIVPDKQTQIKIASFLMSFDFQISAQERILMLLNDQRRALLQQLFIWRAAVTSRLSAFERDTNSRLLFEFAHLYFGQWSQFVFAYWGMVIWSDTSYTVRR